MANFNVHMASQYMQHIMHNNLVFRVLQTKSAKYLWFLMHKYLILIRIKSYTSSSIVMHLSFVENSGLEFQVMEEFWCPNLIFPMALHGMYLFIFDFVFFCCVLLRLGCYCIGSLFINDSPWFLFTIGKFIFNGDIVMVCDFIWN